MLFGADKIPEIAKGLGKMMREVKNASNEIKREIKDSSDQINKDLDSDNQIIKNVFSENYIDFFGVTEFYYQIKNIKYFKLKVNV